MNSGDSQLVSLLSLPSQKSLFNFLKRGNVKKTDGLRGKPCSNFSSRGQVIAHLTPRMPYFQMGFTGLVGIGLGNKRKREKLDFASEPVPCTLYSCTVESGQ